jgi:hypothetical protein
MLGPYGIKYLGEKLMERCEIHVHEMLSIVQENKELLIQLRACTMDQFPTGMVSSVSILLVIVIPGRRSRFLD